MGPFACSLWVTDMWTVIATSLKTILAVAVVGGAATAVVAPAFDMASGRSAALNQPTPTHTPDPDGAAELDFETLLLACLDSMDPDSTACGFAHAKSGLSHGDFRLKIVAKMFPETAPSGPVVAPTAEPTKTPLPVVAVTKPAVTTSFDQLLKACLETRDASSDACHRAGQASGLSATDWAAKLRSKLSAVQQSDFSLYFSKCLETRDLTSAVCAKAYELSGMSRADFEAKFKAKLAAKDGTDFWTWFEKCLDTRDEHSAPCETAQSLIGMNDADFHAKFERYLAARSATPKPSLTPKPSFTPKPSASASPKPSATTSTFSLLFQACGESRNRSSDACLKALVASGLQPAEFWAKIEFTYGHFD